MEKKQPDLKGCEWRRHGQLKGCEWRSEVRSARTMLRRRASDAFWSDGDCSAGDSDDPGAANHDETESPDGGGCGGGGVRSADTLDKQHQSDLTLRW